MIGNAPRLLYDRKESARQLSISVRFLDYYIAQKAISVRRKGRKVLIPHSELVRFSKSDHIGSVCGAVRRPPTASTSAEPSAHRKAGGVMKEVQPLPRMDILSNFREQLCKLEEPCAEWHWASRHQAREGVIDASSVQRRSRFDLGRALRAYKVHFKAAHKWVEAAKVIGAFIQRDEKTVFRIIDDYERASQLPAITLDALQDRNIDPAARKNAAIVEELLQQPEPETQEQAAKNVAGAVTKQSIAKKKKAPAKSTTLDFPEFAEWIVKKLEDRYRSVPPEQKESEIRYILELAINRLQVPIPDLKKYSRSTLVPKPGFKEVA